MEGYPGQKCVVKSKRGRSSEMTRSTMRHDQREDWELRITKLILFYDLVDERSVWDVSGEESLITRTGEESKR